MGWYQRRVHGEVTKRNTRSHIKNDEEDISSEHEDFEQEDVYKWGMEKVLAWWRRNLPKSAQTYITMVRECQMTGTDLLELDMGMLQQFGMKKLLARQIMSQIEPLRIESEAAKIDPLHAKVYSKMEKQEDLELNRIRGMDKVNAQSKAAMNGMLTNVLNKRKHDI